MSEILLIDTDVLIDYLRGKSQAINFLENTNSLLLICSITVAELFAGVCEGEDERDALDEFFKLFEEFKAKNEPDKLSGYQSKNNTADIIDNLIKNPIQVDSFLDREEIYDR